MGWFSMALPLLRSEDSPLDTGRLSTSEMSWIASIMPLGGIAGNCFCGIFIAIFGARHTVVLIGFPQLVRHNAISTGCNQLFTQVSFDLQIAWAFLIFGYLPWHLAFSRFLGGFSFGGGQTCIFLFIAEIADNE